MSEQEYQHPEGVIPPGMGDQSSQERQTSQRPFVVVQAELKKLISNPDSRKEMQLRIERARLVNQAKEVGIFSIVKRQLEDAQVHNDFKTAAEKIVNIKTQRLEEEAMALTGWDDSFRGMIPEYKDVALLNMKLAMIRARGGGITTEAKKLEREIEIRGWGSPPQWLESKAKEFLDGLKRGGRSKVEDILEEQVEHQRKQTHYARQQTRFVEQQTAAMIRSYNDFINTVRKRSFSNPEHYEQPGSAPGWYQDLPETQQDIVKNLLNINYLAYLKKMTGSNSYEQWASASVRIEDIALDEMMKEQPAFAETLATVIIEVFDKYKRDEKGIVLRDENDVPILQDHLVISGTPQEKDEDTGKIKKEATGGYELLSSEKKLAAYRKNLEDRMTVYLTKKYGGKYEFIYKVTNRRLAELAVASVDNLFYGAGAYDSGDELRKIGAGEELVVSEAIRTLFMPGVKGKTRWFKLTGDLPGTSGRDLGGPLGAWMRDNSFENRDGFRKKLQERGENQLIPDRIMYDMLSHSIFSKTSESRFAGKTLAQALLMSDKIEDTYVDEEFGAVKVWRITEDIPMKDLPANIYSDYSDTRSAPIAIYEHITSNKAEKRLSRDVYVNLVIKAREDALLNPVYRDPDFITAGIIMVVSPTGLVYGIPEMLLNIDENVYVSNLRDAISERRLFKGMDSNFLRDLVTRLHAPELLSRKRSIIAATLPVAHGLVSRVTNPKEDRAVLREIAARNTYSGIVPNP